MKSPGKPVRSLEIEPPAVFTSTGTEMAYLLSCDQEDDGQLEVAGGVERLPELALAGGAVAGGAVDDFVALVLASRSAMSSFWL